MLDVAYDLTLHYTPPPHDHGVPKSFLFLPLQTCATTDTTHRTDTTMISSTAQRQHMSYSICSIHEDMVQMENQEQTYILDSKQLFQNIFLYHKEKYHICN